MAAQPLPFASRETWFLSPMPKPADFLEAMLPRLPGDTFLCIEGTQIDTIAVTVFQRHAVSPTSVVRADTPESRQFHIPNDGAGPRDLIDLLQRNPSVRWGHHLKIYRSDGIIVHWHDADTGWLPEISTAIPEDVISQVASDLGASYE